uniref:Hemimethylated DNA-binding domain-containing protein n=1 Tax=Meloidogyne floridensis TaxID=298350 RepID=A0A915NUT6_9BILA
MEPPSKENATFVIFTLKLGNEDTHFATLTGLEGKRLDYGSSAKYRINLLFSKRDGYKENSLQMIAEGNEAISLLGLDMELWNHMGSLYDEMEFPSKSCHLALKLDGYKFHSTTSHCFFANQNFITNRIEIWTVLRNLACNVDEAEKQENSGIDLSAICKYKSAETNKMRSWNSVNLTLCYYSKFGDQLKINPKSDYAKACSTNKDDDDHEKHGIEFRVYATRIGFNNFSDNYWIKFGVNVEIGSLLGVFRSKNANRWINLVTGKIESYPDEEPYLGILNRTENNIKLISIQLGNNGMNFAILTDEMNGNVYDYGSSVLSNLEHKNIQEIVEADGAFALIGPDMNKEGKRLSAANFEIISVPEKSCLGSIELMINDAYVEKEFSCVSSDEPRHPRPPHIKYKVGQVVKHKLHNYRGVIVGWDEKVKAPDWWIKRVHGTEEIDEPNYTIIIDTRDRLVPQIAYVLERNILLSEGGIVHPLINHYFESFDGKCYKSRPWHKN